jgi:hypothetical protein
MRMSSQCTKVVSGKFLEVSGMIFLVISSTPSCALRSLYMNWSTIYPTLLPQDHQAPTSGIHKLTSYL